MAHPTRTLAATRGVAALALLLAVSCASTTARVTQRPPENERLPRPPVVVVYDFAVTTNDAMVDTFGTELAGDSEPAREPTDSGHKTARALSQSIVDALNRRGIQAIRGTAASAPPLDAGVLKGQFLKIKEGSRLARMTIGFGAGSPELRVRVQVYQATSSGLRRLAEAEGEATGSKLPGMAVPLAGGAALGNLATSAAISGGVNVGREVKGALDDEISAIAEEIAERMKSFYERRGWL